MNIKARFQKVRQGEMRRVEFEPRPRAAEEVREAIAEYHKRSEFDIEH